MDKQTIGGSLVPTLLRCIAAVIDKGIVMEDLYFRIDNEEEEITAAIEMTDEVVARVPY